MSKTLTKQFANVMVGGADKVWIYNRTIGSVSEMSVKTIVNKLRKEGGRPKRLKKTAITEFGVDVELSMDEIRAENFLLGMGVEDNILTKIEGAKVSTLHKTIVAWQSEHAYTGTIYMQPTTLNGKLYVLKTPGTSATVEPTWNLTGDTTDGTAVWTAMAYPGETVTRELWLDETDIYCYALDFDNVQAGYRVYNSDFTTEYTDETDFDMDKIPGRIIWTNGTAPAGLKVLYEYKPIDQIQINLKPEDTIIAQVPLRAVFLRPTTGLEIELLLWSVQSNQITLPMGKDWASFKPKFSANSKEEYTDCSLGYMFFYTN